MRNDLTDIFQDFIQDIEDASPNTKNKLKELYPINFKLNLSGHKDIFISLDEKLKKISFDEIINPNFEINISVSEIFELIITKKIKKTMLIGDVELAIVLVNTIIKSDLDFIYLLDKYFGNVPAVIAYLAKQKFDDLRNKDSREDNSIQSKLREISIRLDRIEAMNNQ
tara:strand:- start:18 stop:521 length:504 start_codon:yes stop_codon:yes gene_type:complete